MSECHRRKVLNAVNFEAAILVREKNRLLESTVKNVSQKEENKTE